MTSLLMGNTQGLNSTVAFDSRFDILFDVKLLFLAADYILGLSALG